MPGSYVHLTEEEFDRLGDALVIWAGYRDRRYGITREQADQFSLRSHLRALAAIQAGKFNDETVPVPVSFTTANGSKPKRVEINFKVDEGPRADTSLEALAGLRPAFHDARNPAPDRRQQL